MARRAYGSTPAVGSSRITVREPATKAMATESFLFMPPLKVSTAEWRLVGRPRSATSLMRKETRYKESRFEMPHIRDPRPGSL